MVSNVLNLLAHGVTLEDVLRGYPQLTRDDVFAALEYAGAHDQVDFPVPELLAGVRRQGALFDALTSCRDPARAPQRASGALAALAFLP